MAQVRCGDIGEMVGFHLRRWGRWRVGDLGFRTSMLVCLEGLIGVGTLRSSSGCEGFAVATRAVSCDACLSLIRECLVDVFQNWQQ